MTMRSTVISAIAFSAFLIVPWSGMAAGLYKWVDKDGKVHYSETPRSDGESSSLKVQEAPSDTEPPLNQGESVRGPDGNCLTVKCMADEMESDRLQREDAYARQRAENERAARKRTPSAPKEAPIAESEKDWLRNQCLNGSLGPSTRDCDDYEKLREYAERRAHAKEARRLQKNTPKYGKYR